MPALLFDVIRSISRFPAVVLLVLTELKRVAQAAALLNSQLPPIATP
jgi:hypothetical protein